MILPITFQPLTMPRIWGGRQLESTYQRTLPPAPQKIGESWEIVDRPNQQSIATSNPYTGKSLHQLWQNHRLEIFGPSLPNSHHFPILIKILDAADDLSIQVHPPTHLANQLGGEPKTEMWIIAHAQPNAKLYVGLKKNTSRQNFEQALHNGTLANCIHVLHPQKNDSIFIPSGRLHAIGAGLLIHEIQQNSDTTYRVFDWNRLDENGKPRDLHIEKSLASINFSDIEPTIDTPQGNILATCPYFHTTRHNLKPNQTITNPTPTHFSIIGLISGKLQDASGKTHPPGSYLLLPVGATHLTATQPSQILQIELPLA